jgi:hypothetical protein
MLPFLLPLVAAAVEAARRRWWTMGAAAGTIAVGVAIYTAAAATFPHWPDRYKNPLYEVTFRLLADGLAAPSLGGAVGIGGAAGVVPYFALAGGVLGWAIWRAGGRRAVALAAGVAVVWIAAYAAAPRTPGGEGPYQRVVRAAVVAGTSP